MKPLLIVDAQEMFGVSPKVQQNIANFAAQARKERRDIIIIECLMTEKGPLSNHFEMRPEPCFGDKPNLIKWWRHPSYKKILDVLDGYNSVTNIYKSTGLGADQVQPHFENFYPSVKEVFVVGVNLSSCVQYACRHISALGIIPNILIPGVENTQTPSDSRQQKVEVVSKFKTRCKISDEMRKD